LAQALTKLPKIVDPNLLVGLNTADDAGIYKVNDELALVYTVDVLAPMIEDPFVYGQIAAANSISDIYAMGGDPKLALNIIAYPGTADPAVLGEILRGGQEKAREAGVTIAGGHTFNNADIKFGMAVIGYIHPDRIITNADARPDDVIVLTKPVGVGTLIQAYFTEKIEVEKLAEAIKAMTTLNRNAAEAMKKTGGHAATDITGYGLAGHIVEMAQASKVGVELWSSKIPFHERVFEIFQSGVADPGINMNRTSFGQAVVNRTDKTDIFTLLFGSETSGGLAVVLPEKDLTRFNESYGQPAWVIGRVTADNPGTVTLIA
jgi:selenide,water dikinase